MAFTLIICEILRGALSRNTLKLSLVVERNGSCMYVCEKGYFRTSRKAHLACRKTYRKVDFKSNFLFLLNINEIKNTKITKISFT